MNVVNADEMIKVLKVMKQLGYGAIAIDGMVKAIKERSRPVIEAKWIKEVENGMYWYVCSNCKGEVPTDRYGHYIFSQYCPHCGAIMQDIDSEEK